MALWGAYTNRQCAKRGLVTSAWYEGYVSLHHVLFSFKKATATHSKAVILYVHKGIWGLHRWPRPEA